MRGPDEGRRLHHGGFRCGSDNGASEAFIFQPVREGFSSEYAFRARFSHFSVSLTSPSGRKYIIHVVKLGDSSVGAGVRGVTEKGNTYPHEGVEFFRGLRQGDV